MMKKSLILIAFITGYLIMSLEILGGRLLAPYFGYSIYVWGTLIGLILTALSAGYYLGGWLSEYIKEKSKKENPLRFLSFIYFAITLFLLAGLFYYLPVLNYFAGKSIIWGALAAAFALFFVPMILLAAVSPIIIKTLSQTEKIGVSAGLVYAWGTVGSIFGTFLTTFFLIPYLGSRLTFYSCFFITLLLLIGLVFLSSRRFMMLGFFIFLISLVFFKSSVLAQNVILETESAYNRIRLIEENGIVYMLLNTFNENSIQSAYVKDGTLFNLSLVDLFNIGAEVSEAKDILVLGMGGGASVRQFQQYFPEAKIDAVEIDSKIVAIAEEKFGVRESDKLQIFVEDARTFLNQLDKKYDLIEVDLFQGNPYIPFYTITKEFFGKISGALSNKGVLVMNIYAPNEREILEPALNTIATVFPSVYKIPIGDSFLILATKQETTAEEIVKKIQDSPLAGKDELSLINRHALLNLSVFYPKNGASVFTDDWSPVEIITYKMLKGARL